jgi:methionyl-tRNA formyltransferase
MTRPLRRADGRLDPSSPAWLLERQVRAYLPWPGTFLEADGQRLVVLAAALTPSDADDEPGRIVPDLAGLALATVEGRLVLLEVQPAGGRPMSGEAFLRGRPSILGTAVVRDAGPGPSAPGSTIGSA